MLFPSLLPAHGEWRSWATEVSGWQNDTSPNPVRKVRILRRPYGVGGDESCTVLEELRLICSSFGTVLSNGCPAEGRLG